MNSVMIRRRPWSLPLLFAGGVALTVALALLIFYLMMRPPMNEIGAMAAFLTITAVISLAAGHGAYRMGWISRSPRVSWTLLGGYALSSVLTFINVWVTARLMFASQHDLLLATVLLLFAGGIAMSLGYFLSTALTDDIVVLNQAAKEIAKGNLHVRMPVTGQNEMAELGHTFNEMARQLGGTAIFTEPYVHSGRTVKKIQRLKRFEIPEGATVLFVEDVITTGKSTREMVEAVLQSEDGIKFRRERKILPHVLCLVNRSGEKKIRNEGFDPHDWDEDAWGLDIVSLAEVKARTWDTVEEAMSDLWAGEGKYSQSDVHAGTG